MWGEGSHHSVAAHTDRCPRLREMQLWPSPEHSLGDGWLLCSKMRDCQELCKPHILWQLRKCGGVLCPGRASPWDKPRAICAWWKMNPVLETWSTPRAHCPPQGTACPQQVWRCLWAAGAGLGSLKICVLAPALFLILYPQCKGKVHLRAWLMNSTARDQQSPDWSFCLWWQEDQTRGLQLMCH